MYNEIIEEIKKANTIYVTGHTSPDGDSIGSTFAMYLALKKIGKSVLPILSKYSNTFSFLPHIQDAISEIKEDSFDLLICVDSSTKERLAISKEDYNKAKRVIMLDHHVKDIPYADVYFIDNSLPAASEVVFNLINELDIKIDFEIATYIYMGLLTDTGSFCYSSTKPSTLRAAATLMECGIDHSKICKKINDTMSEKKLFLVKKAIENMEVFFDGKVRYTYIDYQTILALEIDEEDAEGMTNYLRAVEGTEVAVYVRGKSDGTLKVSMRSNEIIDVSKIAIALGGGGHKRAAGYTMNIENTYEEEKEKLLDLIGGYLKDDFAG